MLKTIKMAALAAAISLTGMSYSSPSIAQDVEFMIGPDGVRVRTRDFCDRNPYDRRCREYRRHGDDYGRRGDYGDDYGRRYARDGRYGSRCDASNALDKARSIGIRRARIVETNRRSFVVAGRARGDRVVVRIGRDGNCSVFR